ncbi:putative resolvase [Candidatus Terasakiella magnetica]|uniref:Putative resolvase n=1 Tax=Candidatus Terasakiella magnetica TaxID=1867952 RepID=A0A1C3RI78_9PROT|nr:recombinase family protein [Candidatus Terasakiella magnetica]SCA56970.1 putative resolvase [Candidatus Terasakiella magnetica]
MSKKTVRCAIYTRKSTEEGLDQTFNTLHAQREACEAYIQSQRHEGWITLPTLYDDGGFSGGNMDRPALKQLMADIEAGLIDTVVVYKIDRLTRALADFAKMVEIFDNPDHPVSFVSVTQQFNTTTSMGRLTLNVLLSFAQFEREVIGERVRDKIAASKKKGMWMGGLLALGYDKEDKLLVINEDEANTVRDIFQTYLKLKSVRELKANLDKRGIVSKLRISKTGNLTGGNSLARGALYTILRNPVYIGKIRHKQNVYDAKHEPIIDMGLWQQVQDVLDENQNNQEGKVNCKNGSLLTGLIFDRDGNRLTPSHAVKKTASGKKRYRYYVNESLRLPAADIEQIVIINLCAFLNDPKNIKTTEDADRYAEFVKTLKDDNSFKRVFLVKQLVHSITVDTKEVTIQVSNIELNDKQDSEDSFASLNIPAQLKRCGMEKKIVLGEVKRKPKNDATLITILAKAHTLMEKLTSTDQLSLSALARQEGVSLTYIGKLLRVSALSPKIQEAIITGTQPQTMTANKLMTLKTLPSDWSEQEQLFGI